MLDSWAGESARSLQLLETSRVAASNFALLKVTVATILVSCPLFIFFALGSGLMAEK